MKKPEIEQLINEGKTQGTNFNRPLDFSSESWGKYDEKNNNWGTADPETGKLPYVATFGQVRKWIQDKFRVLTQNVLSFGETVDTVERDMATLQQNVSNGLEEVGYDIQNINNKLSDINAGTLKEYTIQLKSNNGSDVSYTQTHNVFRITRPDDATTSWKLKVPEDEIELRLGPFDELLSIGNSGDTDVDIVKSSGYIELSDVVDFDEEIIIKIIRN